MLKLAIVYPFFAHYREPILKELNLDEELDVDYISGIDTNKFYDSLKLIDFSKNEMEFLKVKNYWFLNYFLWQKNLLSTLKKDNYDCVIFLSDWKYISTWFALLYLRIKKTPTLFWSHGITKNEANLNTFLKLKFHGLFSHGGFLYSEKAKRVMEEMGYKKTLKVLYNSLDYENHKLLQNNTELTTVSKNNQSYLIFIGRLVKSRKLDILFESIKILNTQNINVKVKIVGDGPEITRFKSVLADLNLNSHVEFLGAIYDEKRIAKLLQNSIAYVFPGPIGLGLIHAMSYGVPVITNDNIENHKPEIEALIPNVTGFVFKDHDSYSLSRVIKKVLSLNSEEIKVLKKNCLSIIEQKYNPKSQVSTFKNLVKEAIN